MKNTLVKEENFKQILYSKTKVETDFYENLGVLKWEK